MQIDQGNVLWSPITQVPEVEDINGSRQGKYESISLIDYWILWFNDLYETKAPIGVLQMAARKPWQLAHVLVECAGQFVWLFMHKLHQVPLPEYSPNAFAEMCII